jgi:hypothetical protein
MSDFGKALETTTDYRLPCIDTFNHAAKIAIVEDKPILLDYWTGSIEKTVFIGQNPEKEKYLIRNDQEYTSTVSKIYGVKTEYIVITENSIYIVDKGIPTRRISAT